MLRVTSTFVRYKYAPVPRTTGTSNSMNDKHTRVSCCGSSLALSGARRVATMPVQGRPHTLLLFQGQRLHASHGAQVNICADTCRSAANISIHSRRAKRAGMTIRRRSVEQRLAARPLRVPVATHGSGPAARPQARLTAWNSRNGSGLAAAPGPSPRSMQPAGQDAVLQATALPADSAQRARSVSGFSGRRGIKKLRQRQSRPTYKPSSSTSLPRTR